VRANVSSFAISPGQFGRLLSECEFLLQRVLQGKSVVRLKGGCVSTFSRVSSEAAALAAAGLAYEMVPGVSSATAAPVLAGM
jgi:siroheme synthase